jgi:hypothetical protein
MKHDIYSIFCDCYKNADFAELMKTTHKDCTYQSYDFLYVLKGRDNVINTLKKQAQENISAKACDKTDINLGFYQKTQFLFKTLKDCVIITRHSDKYDIRVLCFGIRWGKIVNITGIDPRKHKHIMVNKKS